VLGQIVDNVVVPRLMGNLVGLNPLWLLFTVFLGAKVDADMWIVEQE
jgi:predicted PurR-regulated permease PerM